VDIDSFLHKILPTFFHYWRRDFTSLTDASHPLNAFCLASRICTIQRAERVPMLSVRNTLIFARKQLKNER